MNRLLLPKIAGAHTAVLSFVFLFYSMANAMSKSATDTTTAEFPLDINIVYLKSQNLLSLNVKNHSTESIDLRAESLRNPFLSVKWSYRRSDGKTEGGGWGQLPGGTFLREKIRTGPITKLGAGETFQCSLSLAPWLMEFRKTCLNILSDHPDAIINLGVRFLDLIPDASESEKSAFYTYGPTISMGRAVTLLHQEHLP